MRGWAHCVTCVRRTMRRSSRFCATRETMPMLRVNSPMSSSLGCSKAIPLAVRLHYRLHKSGLVLWVREGIAINIFIDRMRIKQANRYYRVFCDLREERIKVTGASI